MANASSIMVGIIAVSAICGLSFVLGQNKTNILNEEKINNYIDDFDKNFEISNFYISKNQKCALVFGKNDKIILIKSMGQNYSIKFISKNEIYKAGDFLSFNMNDFAFPNFSEEFSTQITEL